MIALKRHFDRAQLLGYVTCPLPPYECAGKFISLCILVKVFIGLELNQESHIDHVRIQVVPSRVKGKTGLFVHNAHSTPSERGVEHNLDALFRGAIAKAASNPFLICGNFIAP
ncbi:hypothetical protein HPB52_004829 [Rhipicephalus sanguineus]|uniref:Uncharacterized protein n=1 Tax=Rhipicephalus sanguineus TaxID=34632 RepID=A0A9D4PU93_RHISA|nr:hypothetical protein HPB52_004829 [Rhipicephalus sanguineus]